MKYLRVVDQIGNKQDVQTEHIPRIGERIMMTYSRGGEPVREHFFRVKDVEYRLENKPEHQAAILVEEESSPERWPS